MHKLHARALAHAVHVMFTGTKIKETLKIVVVNLYCGESNIYACTHSRELYTSAPGKGIYYLYQNATPTPASTYFPDLSPLELQALLSFRQFARRRFLAEHSGMGEPSSYNPQPWLWGHALVYAYHLEEFRF